jgi:hypothetical protein
MGVAAVSIGLVTSPNLQDPDAFYAALVAAHGGLSEAASDLLNARLVLILANHIGDPIILHAALALARDGPAAGDLPREPAAPHKRAPPESAPG